MIITDQDVAAVYDVARQDHLAKRHEITYAPDRWAQRTDGQKLAYDVIFVDGPQAL